MRWKGRQQSENVEDRRGMSPQMAMGGGGGIVVVLIVLALKFFNAPPAVQQIAGQLAQQAQQQQRAAPAEVGDGIDDEAREFIAVVLNDTEEVWTKLFQEQVRGGSYRKPKLVIYEGRTTTGCGTGDARMGPFYCPADQVIYIDPGFFDELARRHKAPGDFAQAYVIAHEVAHHVQRLLGFSDPVDAARQRGDEVESNRMSVRLELQADFLAGVWANHAHERYNILEEGDVEEAIRAANQIGDDTLQKMATGVVVPERFTHGTSAQRVRWFRRGVQSGDLKASQQLFTLSYDQL
ncbi:MAG: neutral zinc metallopeptidase [Planctomycetaceae bacterium]